MSSISTYYNQTHLWVDEKWPQIFSSLPKNLAPALREIAARVCAVVLGTVIYTSETIYKSLFGKVKTQEGNLDIDVEKGKVKKIEENDLEPVDIDPYFINDDYNIRNKLEFSATIDTLNSELGKALRDKYLVLKDTEGFAADKFVALCMLDDSIAPSVKEKLGDKPFTKASVAKVLLEEGFFARKKSINETLFDFTTEVADLDIDDYVILSDGYAYGISKDPALNEVKIFLKDGDIISPYTNVKYKEPNLRGFMEQFAIQEDKSEEEDDAEINSMIDLLNNFVKNVIEEARQPSPNYDDILDPRLLEARETNPAFQLPLQKSDMIQLMTLCGVCCKSVKDLFDRLAAAELHPLYVAHVLPNALKKCVEQSDEKISTTEAIRKSREQADKQSMEAIKKLNDFLTLLNDENSTEDAITDVAMSLIEEMNQTEESIYMHRFGKLEYDTMHLAGVPINENYRTIKDYICNYFDIGILGITKMLTVKMQMIDIAISALDNN